MQRLLFFVLLSVFLLPARPASAFSADLGFRNNNDLFFSSERLVTGQTVRIYARVRNFGSADVAGYVYFMQGDSAIGSSQVISVRAGGSDEEVYVDFVVPEEAFNVRAEIRGTDPADENSSNDLILSNLYTPVQDADDDGVEDDLDDCPTVADPTQVDTDGDLIGDACDDDDDNDSLSDAVEEEIGLNPKKADSDGDGASDPHDYAPNDPSVTGAPVATPEPEPTTTTSQTNEDSAASDASAEGSAQSSAEAATSSAEDTGVPSEPNSQGSIGAAEQESTSSSKNTDLQISPNAVFQYEQTGWNSYRFSVRGFEGDSYRYAWDFGDGVSSSRSSVDHTYRTFGDYRVSLTVTDSHDQSATDATTISVSFFHFENPYLKLLLGVLITLCIISIGLFIRTGRHQRI